MLISILPLDYSNIKYQFYCIKYNQLKNQIMKTKITLFIALLITMVSIAQNGINYKAIIKDNTGNIIVGDLIVVQFEIRQGSDTGPMVYQETHTPTTDDNGLIMLNIGEGTPTPTSPFFADVDWGSDSHFLNVQANTGAGLEDMGTTQFKTVPYAINALNSNDNSWQKNVDDISNTNSGNIGFGVDEPKVKFHFAEDQGFLFGNDTIGAGSKIMYMPQKNAFRIGTLATGAASVYWNDQIYTDASTDPPKDLNYVGLYSFATGLNNRAQGYAATAMGRDTEATNSYAHATGYFTNADGLYSTAMGFNTDAFATGSTALGYSTDAEANYSTAIGYFAEAQGLYSTAIGHSTKAVSYGSVAIGRFNIGSGNTTSWVSTDPIFEVGIGSSSTNRANAMTIRKNGNVGIGTTVPLDALHVNGRIRLETVEYIADGGTSEIEVRGDLRPSADNTYDIGTSALRYDDVFATSGVVNTSDRRDKKDIKSTSYGLNEIMQLEPVEYNWKDSRNDKKKLGLVAQDLLEVIPEVVKTHDWQDIDESDNPQQKRVKLDRMGVYYSDLIPVLIKAIQEQQTTIESLKTKVETQDVVITRLIESIETLKQN